MTEKQTNRFTDFTFGQKDDREKMEVNKDKSGFHHHEVKLQLHGTPNQQTTFYLTR